jgi:hypothetical protein
VDREERRDSAERQRGVGHRARGRCRTAASSPTASPLRISFVLEWPAAVGLRPLQDRWLPLPGRRASRDILIAVAGESGGGVVLRVRNVLPPPLWKKRDD